MKTTIDLPEEILQRAKITAIQRKTTLKELIYQSLLRELDEPAQAKPDTNELADAFSRGLNFDAPIGRFDREQAQRYPTPPSAPSQTVPEDKLPFVRDPQTGFLVSRRLDTPGFVPPTVEQSNALIARANEEDDLHRAGLLP